MRSSVIEEDLKFIAEANLPWELLEGKTVLISGANGLVPAYLAETILYLNEKRFKNKAKVLALVRNKEKAVGRFDHYKSRTDLAYIVQDVCEPLKIKGDVHFIIHAASHASPKHFGKDPVGTLLPNIIGSKNLLDLARDKKSQGYLFLSGGEVYGEVGESDVPIQEDTFGALNPIDLRSCYAESKRMGENMCASWYSQYQVPAKVARLFHTFGPGLDLNDGRVFADFISNILSNKNIVLRSDGSAVRSFCYLADAAVGLFTVLLKGKGGEAYNVGNDKGEISILNLAKMLIEAFPEKHLKIEMRIDGKQEGYLRSKFTRHHPDINKLKMLDYDPKFSVRDGFLRTVRSFA